MSGGVQINLTEAEASYQAPSGVRSPPPRRLESLNNGSTLSGSQTNICNGNSTVVEIIPKKRQNGSPNSNRRPVIQLTHLQKRHPVEIKFIDLSYTLNGSKAILKNVCGKFSSGELTGIMGPSGAGKSTLMNILAGYKTSFVSGSVLINGKERNLRRFRKMSCYIMQDDCLMPHLTVREALVVSANLKLGKSTSKQAKNVVIAEITEALGLDTCTNTLTMNLSGGQRKRLSIALELVNNPPVMFFDEPTSGLDSSSCFQCLSLMKSLARGGRTIICTIHQPSARLFEMFDQLYMMADGQCIYQGVVTGLVPFLGSMDLHCPSYHNPADYVMEVACGEHGDHLENLVSAVNEGKCVQYNRPQQSPGSFGAICITNDIAKERECLQELALPPPTPGEVVLPNGKMPSTPASATCTTSLLNSNENVTMEKLGFPTSGLLQFWILLKRTFLSIVRDQTLTRMRIVAHFVIGLLIGLIYYDVGNEASKVSSNAGCIFFTVMFINFTAMMPTILTFPMEMSVFAREHLNYWYSLKAFYFAKTIADIPFQIAFTSMYVIGVYFVTSQPYETTRFFMVLGMCVLTSLVAQSLGLLLGAALDIETGTFLGPVSSIPVILFSGFFVKLNVIPWYLKWLPYLSYLKYSFEGCMIAIYGYGRPKLECSEIYCHFRKPQKFLEEFSVENTNYLVNAMVLIAIFVLIRVVAYFALRLKLRSFR